MSSIDRDKVDPDFVPAPPEPEALAGGEGAKSGRGSGIITAVANEGNGGDQTPTDPKTENPDLPENKARLFRGYWTTNYTGLPFPDEASTIHKGEFLTSGVKLWHHLVDPSFLTEAGKEILSRIGARAIIEGFTPSNQISLRSLGLNEDRLGIFNRSAYLKPFEKEIVQVHEALVDNPDVYQIPGEHLLHFKHLREISEKYPF